MCESRPKQHSGSGSLTMTATKVSDTTCPLMVHSSWIPRKMRLMRLSSWMQYISSLCSSSSSSSYFNHGQVGQTWPDSAGLQDANTVCWYQDAMATLSQYGVI